MALDAIQLAMSGSSKSSRDMNTLRALGRTTDLTKAEQAVDGARKLVSELCFKPMLEQMRSFPFGQDIGGGGRGEEVFGQQLDERVADAAADTSLKGFTESIAKKLLGGANTATTSNATSEATKATSAANSLSFLQALWSTQQAVAGSEGTQDGN